MNDSSSARLLVDLDGTVCWHLPRVCEYLDAEYGVRLDPAKISRYVYEVDGLGKHVGEVVDELIERRPEWYLLALEPIPGARSSIRKLANEGYHISIATHRPPASHEVTRRWLEQHDIVYDSFIETVPTNKGLLDGDVLIDDYHGNVRDAIENGKRGILMRQAYSDPESCSGAHVATSWDDVEELLL